MTTAGVVLLIVAVAAAISVLLLVWNSRQRERNVPPPRRHRDLDLRIDHVVSGARDVADRAVRLVGSTDAPAVASAWPMVRTDMLAIEGDIVNVDIHVGEAPVGRSLADLDRAVNALRDTVERHVELSAADAVDEQAIALSHEAIAERRRAVAAAIDEVEATRP